MDLPHTHTSRTRARLQDHQTSGKNWSLEKSYPEWTYELIHDENCLVIPCPDWQWADLDGDRLVYAEQGKLYSARLNSEGLTKVTELYDFNPFKFEAIRAPY